MICTTYLNSHFGVYDKIETQCDYKLDNDMMRQRHDIHLSYHAFNAHMIKKMIKIYYLITCLTYIIG